MLPDRSADVYTDPELAPSLTQQQFAKECDINVIVKQNAETGLISHVNSRPAQFADLGDGMDYQAHQNYLIEADAAFMGLPAEVRARFDNNPAKLLDFLQDDKNVDEARELGLLNPLPETPPAPAPEAPQKVKRTKMVEVPIDD